MCFAYIETTRWWKLSSIFLSCSFVRDYQLLATKDIKDGSKMMMMMGERREIDGWIDASSLLLHGRILTNDDSFVEPIDAVKECCYLYVSIGWDVRVGVLINRYINELSNSDTHTHTLATHTYTSICVYSLFGQECRRCSVDNHLGLVA